MGSEHWDEAEMNPEVDDERDKGRKLAAWIAGKREPREGAPRNAEPSNAGGHTCPGGAPSCASTDGSESAELAHIRQKINDPDWDGDYAGEMCHGLLRMVDELTVRLGGLNAETEKRIRYGEMIGQLEKERDDLRGKLASTEPEWDATDGAHPCWWRGHDRAAKMFSAKIQEMNVNHTKLTDELRAKLSEQSDELERLRALDASHAATDAAWRERVVELLAQLADAEAEVERWRKAAESMAELRLASEKRVREGELCEAENEIEFQRTAKKWAVERAEAAEARVRELELAIRLIAAGNGNSRTEHNR